MYSMFIDLLRKSEVKFLYYRCKIIILVFIKCVKSGEIDWFLLVFFYER